MNPHDGQFGQANSNLSNDPNEVNHYLLVDSIERLLPLLSPQQGLSRQVTNEIRLSGNIAPRYALQEQLMHGGLHTNTIFFMGQSSNISGRANNNLNLSPQPLPPMQQIQQYFSQTRGIEYIQGYANSNNVAAHTLQYHAHASRRGMQGIERTQDHQHGNLYDNAARTLQSHAHVNIRDMQGLLQFSSQPLSYHHHHVNPQSFPEIESFTTTSAFEMFLIQQMTLPVLPIQYVPIVQGTIPILLCNFNYEALPLQQVSTEEGRIHEFQPHVIYPNQVTVNGLPIQQIHPSVPYEPQQMLSRFVNNNWSIRNDNTTMYQPLNQQMVPSPSSSSLQANVNFADGSNFGTQNYHNQLIIPPLQSSDSYEVFPIQQVPTVENRMAPSENLFDLVSQMFLHMIEGEFDSQPHMGLSVEAIMQHLKCENFKSLDTENPDEKDTCVICQFDFEDGDELGKLDLCMHKYHIECIKKWLMNKNQCPICKQRALNVNNVRDEV